MQQHQNQCLHKAMALPLDKLNKLLRTAALGVEVVQTATKGRGIVATRARTAPAPPSFPRASRWRIRRCAPSTRSRAMEISPHTSAPGARHAARLEGADGRRHPLMIAQIASRVAQRARRVALRAGRRRAVLGQDVGADAGALGRGLRGRQARPRGR